MEPHVMVMAGGTGGHLFPALAVAQWLQERNCRITWLGSSGGMEKRLIPEYGYPICTLDVKGIRGSGLKRSITAPWVVGWSFIQAYRLLRQIQPNLVLGMGGFVTGPGGLAARAMKIPLVIQEQNAIPGFTNRMLARFASKVFEAFPGSFGDEAQAEAIGNPVRQEIADLQPPEIRFAERSGPIRLLVLGGSLGAQALNQTLPKALAMIPEENRPLVRHQAGEKLLQETIDCYRSEGIQAEIQAFVKDMADVYGWADLVLCRSGALTVTELAAAGVGAILVPYPYAVDDHQTYNARFLVQAGAAQLLPQPCLNPHDLAAQIADLGSSRNTLLQMAQAARQQSRSDAAAKLGRFCLETIQS